MRLYLRVSQACVVCLCSQLQSKNICPHLSITTPLKWVSQTNPQCFGLNSVLACLCVKINAYFKGKADVLPDIRNATLGQTKCPSACGRNYEIVFHDRDLWNLVLRSKCPYLSSSNLLCFSPLLLNLICSLALLYSQWCLCSVHLHPLVPQKPAHLLDILKPCCSHTKP